MKKFELWLYQLIEKLVFNFNCDLNTWGFALALTKGYKWQTVYISIHFLCFGLTLIYQNDLFEDY